MDYAILILSKEHNKIFGGYSNIPMTSSGKFVSGGGNSKLFSYTDQKVFN